MTVGIGPVGDDVAEVRWGAVAVVDEVRQSRFGVARCDVVVPTIERATVEFDSHQKRA